MSVRNAWLVPVLALVVSHGGLRAQGMPTGVVGWYNGDWKQLIPSGSNWYISAQQYAREYDDFVVPDGGWTITGVFAHTDMPQTPVSQAYWEIRSGMALGNGGTLIASGVTAASQTQSATVGGGTYVFLLVASGLWVQLAPGHYWLNVSPVVTNSASVYLCHTLGTGAIGTPAGNNGGAFFDTPAGPHFTGATGSGSGGTSDDFSMGVLIAAPAAPRNTAWASNISSLTQQMSAMHSTPFPGISLADFNSNAANLAARVPSLSDAEVRTGFEELVASVGDPHTSVEWPAPSPFRFLPLTFYWFDDGIYVTGAPAAYQNLLGGKVISIGQSTIADATQRLTPLVAHDNDNWLRYIIPNRLTNTDFLFGTGVAAGADDAMVSVLQPSGTSASADVQALDQSRIPPLTAAYQGPLPLFQQHADKNYWATWIDRGATVYFQYNRCVEDPSLPFSTFLAQLNAMLAGHGVERLVIDMRNNTGGLAILDPWITQMQSSRLNSKGRLYVIVGHATFSAAMEASDLLRDGTAAIFVGQPTGGKPQFLLRRGDFGLPYYGLRASYSSGTERANDPGPTLTPDIVTPYTFGDYMTGNDPALNAILAIPAPGAVEGPHRRAK